MSDPTGVRQVERTDAYQVVDAGVPARLILSCEHASNRLPEPYRWPDEDRRLADTHWAYDIGATALGHALVSQMGAVLVSTRFSRLLVDANRDLAAPTLFREQADGLLIRLNASLEPAEKGRRIERFFRPYHRAFRAVVADNPGIDLLALHTFTPNYEGELRTVELGVLFDTQEALAVSIAARLAHSGYRVALNEPWTGKGGLMWSAEHHALALGRRAIEVELRQDIAADARRVRHVAGCIAEALWDVGMAKRPR
jgi:predicted N-formylglutamate amidohydrolase